jgi:TorA maturation chaperone TorD
MNQTEELRAFLTLRANIYRILGKFFYKEPSLQYFEELKKFLPVFEKFEDVYKNNTLKQAVSQLDDYFKTTESISVGELETLFARIFLSTGFAEGNKSVVPHESVYLSPTGLTMQNERDEVLEFYYKHSVNITDNFHEPEDHITAEMGFMAYLSEKAAELDEQSDEFEINLASQFDFMKKHLMRFAPKVCDDIVEYGHFYYSSMATLIKGFLEIDLDFLILFQNEASK